MENLDYEEEWPILRDIPKCKDTRFGQWTWEHIIEMTSLEVGHIMNGNHYNTLLWCILILNSYMRCAMYVVYTI